MTRFSSGGIAVAAIFVVILVGCDDDRRSHDEGSVELGDLLDGRCRFGVEHQR